VNPILPSSRLFVLALGLLLPAAGIAAAPAQAAPPKEWIDPDTGHRVLRLTNEPGSASLYFNINAFTPDGHEMVYITPGSGIGVVDLRTFQTRDLVAGPVGGSPGAVQVGHKTATVYYDKPTADPQVEELWGTDIATGASRRLAVLPTRGGVFSINADETLAAGSYIIGNGEDYRGRNPAGAIAPQPHALEVRPDKSEMMARRLAARLPMVLFVTDLKTGASRPIFASTDWLDHAQFSPTDPMLLMYAHQGAWNQVDKLWVIRADGTGNRQVDNRIMEMEGAGHQFWDNDGNVWYDLHFPLRGPVSYVASVNVATGARTWYYYPPEDGSIHFNRSADGTLFCGDGGRGPGAQWIYLFRPELIPDNHTLGTNLIRPGVLHAERLVNMAKHNYRLEPNVHFSPDGKYVIFRSNMFGPTYVFAVEIAKSDAGPSSMNSGARKP
jgi:oligogalacturonide lyase